MELPFNCTKMLTFVGWMIERGLKSSSMSSYISALRMYHIALGFNEPVLREPIIKLILKGRSNWDAVSKKINGEVGRLPVTKAVLKLIKKMTIKASYSNEGKLIIWAIVTILWSGSFRVHEILARSQGEYDPQTTLMWEDVKEEKVCLDGTYITALSFRIKSPKIDRVGNGDFIEIYETKLFNCLITAFRKWKDNSRVTWKLNLPVFQLNQHKCYSGQVFNKRLAELTKDLSKHMKGGKITSHSCRAGVASEMCRAGYSEQDIQACFL